MSSVKYLLESFCGVDGWRISEKETESYELFFVHEKLETVRSTQTKDTQVTVYVDHDGKKGDSSFAVYASMTDEEIKGKIAAALSRARLVFNEPYDLPRGAEESRTLPTNLDQWEPRELGAKIAQAVFAADTVEGGSVNACEIFVYRETARVLNSRGMDKTQHSSRVMIEAIPTFTDEKQSVELYEDYRFTQFDPARVTAEIARRMQEVRDRARAERPKTPMEINVLLRPLEIRELMGALAGHDLNYAAVYSHANLHKIGDDLQPGGEGDRLTVTLKGMVPGSEKSAFFDDDGTPLRDTCVIRDGVVAAYHGPSRFGQYLGINPPSGSLPCVQTAPGTLKDGEMRSQPYLECVSMSGLQLDLYNDYIGGEIRLAYYYDGEKTVPVTGISMSGKLSQTLASLRLSENTVTDGPYEGPEYLLMRGIAVL